VRLRDSIRREDPDDPPGAPPKSDPPAAARASTKRAKWDANEPATETRKRSERTAVTVDEVGAGAAKLARTQRESAPKLVASRAVIAKAPIDTRAAFVLSLVDGRNTVDAIIDASGMLEPEVRTILDRLARLGIIALP
jgi:hypothetical protein